MKVFEFSNDYGPCALNVLAIDIISGSNDSISGKFTIEYTLGGTVHRLTFVDKRLRDETLAKIIQLMKEA